MITNMIVIILLVLASLNILGIAYMIVKRNKTLAFILSILEIIIVGGLIFTM